MTSDKLIKGCTTPRDAQLKHIYEQLAQLFGPIVYFDPGERFFPVDLHSTVAASALYRVEGEKYKEEAYIVSDYGSITPVDLAVAGENYFTTVAGWTDKPKELEDPPSVTKMRVPKLKEIEEKYSKGIIPAKLSTYATICAPLREVPNYDLFDDTFDTDIPADISLALQEGLLINYYFYFPAMDSPELQWEGDWSGISILLDKVPHLDHLEEMKPLLACYFKKLRDVVHDYDYLVAGADGLRRWEFVDKAIDVSTGLQTHPVVYISLGRHNCYYEPKDVTIPFGSPWNPTPVPDEIEEGGYIRGPSGGEITGTQGDLTGWEAAIAICPPLIIFDACASACPARGRIPPNVIQEGNDSVRPSGYETDPESVQTGTTPGSDSYPSAPPAPGVTPPHLKLNIVYVDLDDQVMKAHWGYRGSWGAAELEQYTYWKESRAEELKTSEWGRFGGMERPNLAPWFLWNLFWDPVFGCGGLGSYQRPSP